MSDAFEASIQASVPFTTLESIGIMSGTVFGEDGEITMTDYRRILSLVGCTQC